MPPRAGWAASCSETSRGPVTVPWRTRPTNTHAWERIRHGSRATPRRRCAADPPRTAHPHGIAGSRDFRGERPPRALRGGRIIVPPLPRSRPCVRSPARVKQAAGRALHGRSRGDQLRMRTRDAFSAAARRSVRSNPAPCSGAAPDSRLGALLRRDVGRVRATQCWERWYDAMSGALVRRDARTGCLRADHGGRRGTDRPTTDFVYELGRLAGACGPGSCLLRRLATPRSRLQPATPDPPPPFERLPAAHEGGAPQTLSLGRSGKPHPRSTSADGATHAGPRPAMQPCPSSPAVDASPGSRSRAQSRGLSSVPYVLVAHPAWREIARRGPLAQPVRAADS